QGALLRLQHLKAVRQPMGLEHPCDAITSAGLSSTTAMTSVGRGFVVSMSVTFSCWMPTQHTLKHTARCLSQLRCTFRQKIPLSPPSKFPHSIGFSGEGPLPFSISLKLCRSSSILC